MTTSTSGADSSARPLLIVAGARPNFMKIAPIMAELRRVGRRAVLVHTGQHYDAKMSDAFFQDLGLTPPDFSLGVGSGSHAQQTARVMEAFEPVLIETSPSWVVVVGDVNSTLACALVASKLKESLNCRVAHIEAGLRSGDWRMPEEVNRVLTDRLSDLLFLPSHDARENLLREGIEADRIAFAGNVMIDTLFHQLPAARGRDVPGRLGLERGRYALATLHRPSNVDDADSLRTILDALARVAETMPVAFPIHPRTLKNAERFGLTTQLGRLNTMEPLGYTDMLGLTDGAAVALTDSGGLQEETTVLGVPCLTLREQTERPVTVTEGTNRLVPWPPTADAIIAGFDVARATGRLDVGARCPDGWDGHAAVRIVERLAEA